MNENLNTVKALMEDEAFVRSCIEAENEEAVQKLFADKGVDISTEEIELLKEMVGAVADGTITEEQLEKLANGGELSEDELDEVAGGLPWGVVELFTDKHNCRVITNGAFAAGVAGVALSGLMIIGGAAGAVYGICKYKDEIGSGISNAYGWVKENITRW